MVGENARDINQQDETCDDTFSRTQLFYLEPITRMMNVQMREKMRGVSVVLSTHPVGYSGSHQL